MAYTRHSKLSLLHRKVSKLSEKCRLLVKFVEGKTKKVIKRCEEQVNRRVGAVEQGGRAGIYIVMLEVVQLPKMQVTGRVNGG